jgi:hypothetical protein
MIPTPKAVKPDALTKLHDDKRPTLAVGQREHDILSDLLRQGWCPAEWIPFLVKVSEPHPDVATNTNEWLRSQGRAATTVKPDNTLFTVVADMDFYTVLPRLGDLIGAKTSPLDDIADLTTPASAAAAPAPAPTAAEGGAMAHDGRGGASAGPLDGPTAEAQPPKDDKPATTATPEHKKTHDPDQHTAPSAGTSDKPGQGRPGPLDGPTPHTAIPKARHEPASERAGREGTGAKASSRTAPAGRDTVGHARGEPRVFLDRDTFAHRDTDGERDKRTERPRDGNRHQPPTERRPGDQPTRHRPKDDDEGEWQREGWGGAGGSGLGAQGRGADRAYSTSRLRENHGRDTRENRTHLTHGRARPRSRPRSPSPRPHGRSRRHSPSPAPVAVQPRASAPPATAPHSRSAPPARDDGVRNTGPRHRGPAPLPTAPAPLEDDAVDDDLDIGFHDTDAHHQTPATGGGRGTGGGSGGGNGGGSGSGQTRPTAGAALLHDAAPAHTAEEMVRAWTASPHTYLHTLILLTRTLEPTPRKPTPHATATILTPTLATNTAPTTSEGTTPHLGGGGGLLLTPPPECCPPPHPGGPCAPPFP